MLEAKIEKAELLKKILDAVKELVTDANWDCSEDGLKLQAMDNSHIALVALTLERNAFMDDGYRCDRNMSLGMNLSSLQKILKCAGNEDEVTLRATDDSDVLSLTFQDRQRDRMGEYEMKLMDIDQEHLGIPDTNYDATVQMPSSEFLRIVRDIKELGESVKIEVSKEGVKFSAEGDIGTAAVTLRPTTTRGMDEDDDAAASNNDEEEDPRSEDDDAEANGKDDSDVDMSVKSEDEGASKKKKANGASKRTVISDDEDNDDEDDVKPTVIDDDSDEEAASKKGKRSRSETADSERPAKKEKKDAKKGKAKASSSKKAVTKKTTKKSSSTTKSKGKGKKKAGEEDDRDIVISISQSVSLTFSIKYLTNFAKSTPLSDTVKLHMSAEVPLLVEYAFQGGAIRYYLAPKIADD